MGILDPGEIREDIRAAFAGELLTGTLHRSGATTTDAAGDPVPGAPQTWTFDGFDWDFTAEEHALLGIPTDRTRVLIIAGSLGTTPTEGDFIKFTDPVTLVDAWYDVHSVTGDPARASWVCEATRRSSAP